MRTLILGMQSSGATLYAYSLSQDPETVAILDLNNHRQAPALSTQRDAVLKCVVTQTWDLEDHREPFQPNRVVFFVRHPYDNWMSLKDRVYANRSGSLESKFKKLDQYFRTPQDFDEIVRYEDFLRENLGRKLDRSLEQIKEFNNREIPWCRANPAAPGPAGGWGMGNLRKGHRPMEIEAAKDWGAPDKKQRDLLKSWCPRVCEWYGL